MALAILSLGVGLIGTAVFQTLSIQRFWQDDLKATKDARHAASWFAEDALKATETTLVDGEAAVDTVTITTEDGDIRFKLNASGDQLIREVVGGNENVVAENVVDVGFARSQETVTFTLEVAGSRGGTETLTLQNYLRLLES